MQWIYNVVFVSGVQQGGVCVCFLPSSITGYHTICSRGPRAVQRVLVGHLICTQECIHLLIPDSSLIPPHSPSVTVDSLPTSVSLFRFCKYVLW